MSVFKTEITSDAIPSDNPVHQRLLKPYVVVKDQISGDVLELGCGEGRGIGLLLPNTSTYTGIDKIGLVIEKLRKKYPNINLIESVFPPVNTIEGNSFDFIISFQVIEHVKDDRLFLEEIYRMLKPGGVAIITTPNIKKSLSRNPWHVREYTDRELLNLSSQIFDKVETKGVSGNNKVIQYYKDNKKSVDRMMRFDIFNLQHRLPAFLLKIPYEILNRVNRNKLKRRDDELVESITCEDYIITDNTDESLDLMYYMYKK